MQSKQFVSAAQKQLEDLDAFVDDNKEGEGKELIRHALSATEKTVRLAQVQLESATANEKHAKAELVHTQTTAPIIQTGAVRVRRDWSWETLVRDLRGLVSELELEHEDRLQKGALADNSLHNVFSLIDDDSSGEVTSEEFALAMQEIGVKLDEGGMHHLFNCFDKDGNGSITRTEVSVMHCTAFIFSCSTFPPHALFKMLLSTSLSFVSLYLVTCGSVLFHILIPL